VVHVVRSEEASGAGDRDLRQSPYCIPCARVDGFSPEEIAKGAKAFLVPERGPVPSKAAVERRLKAKALVAYCTQQSVPEVKQPEPVEPAAEPQQPESESQEETESMAETKEPERVTSGAKSQAEDVIEPTATLVVTSGQIEQMFAQLSLNTKARIIQEYLDQYR